MDPQRYAMENASISMLAEEAKMVVHIGGAAHIMTLQGYLPDSDFSDPNNLPAPADEPFDSVYGRVIYFNSDDEIPSGHVDLGETIKDGLIREVREETSLAISNILSYANSFDYLSGSGKKTRQYNFVVEVEDGEITLNPEGHSKFQWIDPSSGALSKLNISGETRTCILHAHNTAKGSKASPIPPSYT